MNELFFRQRKGMISYFRSTYPYKYAINIKKLRGKFEHLFTAFCERLKLMPGRSLARTFSLKMFIYHRIIPANFHSYTYFLVLSVESS